jgi:hypothetical protein
LKGRSKIDITGLPEVGDVEGWNRWLKAYARGIANHEYETKHREERNARRRAKRGTKRVKRLSETKPFVGVDGEGAGEGLDHIYWLLRVGDETLYHPTGRNLTTIETLKWLANLGESGLNDRCIPVGYYFGYDVSMILRYLPEKNLRELFNTSDDCLKKNCKHNRNNHWKNYGSCIVQNCSCRRFQTSGHTSLFLDHDMPDANKRNCIQIQVMGRQFKVKWFKKQFLTITDVADFFQSSFLKTLEKWQIASPEELETIRINKERRAYFEYGYDQQTFDYNTLECELLAKLMEEFRSMCFSEGLYPDMWTGPGRLAECVFDLENVPKRADLDIPPMIDNLCNYAYYGGRAEGIVYGEMDNILSLDIASAYPHAYTKLPCLLKGHGKWESVAFEEVQDGNLEHTLVVGKIKCRDGIGIQHPIICGLPMRDKSGNICFPCNANGCWWYPEVRETLKLYEQEGIKYKIQIDQCFSWRQSCNDQPGKFTESWYRKRLAVGKSTRGIPIKLTLNSLYGKAAQRVGSPKWANAVWAGLLTSYTRARLLEAACVLRPCNIISFQTDGIFARSNPEVQEGLQRLGIWTGAQSEPELGSWEVEEFEYLFMIQSGVYSVSKQNPDGSEKITNKTRGMRDFEFEQALPEIRKAWKEHKWFGEFTLPDRRAFVTIQLGILWNKTNVIGCWVDQGKVLQFYTNSNKREIYNRNPQFPKDSPERLTKHGETYAPGALHALRNRRIYGQHPLYPELYASVPETAVLVQGQLFTIPYSKELAEAFAKKQNEDRDRWTFHTPDEPYTANED